MILRRISEGIRQQDWFVVIVEVMIVVVGIFIGLQVDDWNQRQQDRAEELVYLERILADLNDSIILQEAEVQRSEQRFRDAHFALDMLEREHLPADSVARFELGLQYLGVVRSFRLKQETLVEMQSAGKLVLIQNLDVRATLSELRESYQRRLDTIYFPQSRFTPSLHVVDQNIRRITDGEGYLAELHYDFDQLVNTPSFRNAFASSVFLMQVFNDYHTALLNDTRAARDIVQAEVMARREGSSS